MGVRKQIDVPQVLARLKRGEVPFDIAKAMGLSVGTIEATERQLRPDTPELRQRKAATIARRNEQAREIFVALNGIRIPQWVKRADLVSDFCDHARLFDEFAAARHCRRLLAEVRRSA